MSEFTARLRELDLQVEQLRTALVALQRQLSHQQPHQPERTTWTWDPRESDDYLRAYS